MKLKALLILGLSLGSLVLLIVLNECLRKPSPQFILDQAQLDILEVPSAYRSPEVLAFGKRLYLTSCSDCHGNYGTGSKRAPSISDSTWVHGNGHFPHVAEIIRHGIPGTMMLGWSTKFQDTDIKALAAFVTALQTHPKAKL